jgi:hypothetical protein
MLERLQVYPKKMLGFPNFPKHIWRQKKDATPTSKTSSSPDLLVVGHHLVGWFDNLLLTPPSRAASAACATPGR